MRKVGGRLRSQNLIVTVGSSPLPVAAVVATLAPADVHFVYTPQVQKVLDRVVQCMHDIAPAVQVKEMICIERGYESAEIIRRLMSLESTLPPDTDLNYTGGTKALSVHTYAWWRKTFPNGQATYLAADGRMYSDASPEQSFRVTTSLTLEQLCELHFGQKPKVGKPNDASVKAAALIQSRVAGSDTVWRDWVNLLPPAYGKARTLSLPGSSIEFFVSEFNAADKKNFGDKRPWVTGEYGSLCDSLGIPQGDFDSIVSALYGDIAGKNSDDRKKGRLETTKWLWGKWLETWVAGNLRECGVFDNVYENVVISREGEEIEMDVVAIKGCQVYLFSCTTDDKGHVKSKMFEAMQRTNRIGGNLARAAVISLHPAPLNILRTARDEHWEGYDTVRLFGRDHVAGRSASCSIDAQGNAGPEVDLLDGVREWATT